jgi:protease IV
VGTAISAKMRLQMRRFLLGLALLFCLSILLVIVAVLAALGSLGGAGASSARAEVLEWRLDGALPEQPAAPARFFPGAQEELTLAEAYTGLVLARTDERVKGLAITFGDPAFGLARAEEVRRQLAELRAAGKFVECYMETAGEGSNGTLAYYLATQCDAIRLSPVGELNLLGLYAPGLFLRGALDKLRIDPDFKSRGAYKSAVETYTRADFSPAAEEAASVLLDRAFEVLVDGIAQGRKLEPARVRALIDQAPLSAAEALEAGLIDALAYPDEFEANLVERLGHEPSRATLADYAADKTLGSGEQIAVLFASGTILRGSSGSAPFSGEEFLGAEDLAEQLDRLREDDDVAAVVLRVDSPGGSAIASELILRAVDRLAAEKPLVASMGDVAASGGYYIVSKAPTVLAERSTLTGSIGVFMGKLVTRRLQEELLGITYDPQKRGANADIYSSLSVLSPEQSAKITTAMDRTYETFLSHVAEGRKLERDAVDVVAQGRVWSGGDALERDLVDEIGGLDRALELAAEKAGLAGKKPRVVFLPEPPSFFDWLSQHTSVRVELPRQLEEAVRLLNQEPAGARLLLPPELSALASPF